ncbi:MAG: family 78 glycoside hydrolase catalytic domain [Albidovulum sp.]|nr:family 78 glycoside hydrolase catalytic domain [Albidovulum sp.]
MSFRIFDLKTEFATNPIGIGTRRPRFSWKYSHPRDCEQPKYFHILVASTAELLASGEGDLWDSGKVPTSRSPLVEYDGRSLGSRSVGHWKVRLWDSDESASDFSSAGTFEVALLEQSDWRANWVGFPAGRIGKALYFRNTYALDKSVARARAYICGLGWYEFRINGEKVGDRVLEPAQSEFSKRVLYSTYDIAEYLNSGVNAFGAIVGTGWYGVPKLVVQIEVEFADGTKRLMITNGRNNNDVDLWKVSDGPIVSSSVFDGEVYDARLEKPNWDRSTGDESGYVHGGEWVASMVVDPPGGKLLPQTMEPVRIVDTLRAQSIDQPKPGVFVLDNGQNLAGWAALTAAGQRGTAITMRFAECLSEDGTVNQENLRFAEAQDRYIFAEGGIRTWEPRFTYHGFRYIQLEGFPGKPTVDSILTKIVRSDVAATGRFKSSDPLVNRIEKAVRWTEVSNLHGLPTDCPQRAERMGWLNDMAARSEELIYNFDVSRFLPKWLDDIGDAQDPVSGAVSDTAPYRWGARPGDPVSVCYALIPWLLYQHFGDSRVLEAHYPGMKRWADYLTSRAKDRIVEDGYIGDWAPPVTEAVAGSIGTSAVSARTPSALISSAHYYYMLELLARISAAINRNADAREFRGLAANVRSAFNRRFWDERTGGYASNNQACNSAALYLGLVPEERKASVLGNIVKDVEDHDFHLTTGNLCTKYIFDVLSDGGEIETAYRLLTQTSYPSWGYMFERGATTMWERWEEATGIGMNSHNHGMYASIGAWLYKALAGIRTGRDCDGFSNVVIAPKVPSGLKSVVASVDTIRGTIETSWKNDAGGFSLTIGIPPGVDAEVHFPRLGKSEGVLTEGGAVASEESTPGISSIRRNEDSIVFNARSGTYRFGLGPVDRRA